MEIKLTVGAWYGDNTLSIKVPENSSVKYFSPKGAEAISRENIQAILENQLNSIDFIKKMLEVNVVAAPGIGFGKQGEGYVRFSLTRPEEKIKEACERLRSIL